MRCYSASPWASWRGSELPPGSDREDARVATQCPATRSHPRKRRLLPVSPAARHCRVRVRSVTPNGAVFRSLCVARSIHPNCASGMLNFIRRTSDSGHCEERFMKLGLIGAGFIARFQLVALEQTRGIEVAALARRRGSEALAAFCRSRGLGEAKICDSIAEIAQRVDAIAIYVPNYCRIEVMEEIVAAVKAGAQLQGVILEKPLGRNMREARRLVELAREAKLSTAYFENQIHMRAIQTQRTQLLPVMKRMGPLTLTRSSEEHGGPHEPWFWDPTRQGGGVLLDMGCHSIAVGRHVLTPPDRDLLFLQPLSVSAELGLLKWGLPQWRAKLLQERGVDYSKTPAEDFATGMITYRNPETGQKVKAQFTDSWMFEKQGLRLFMDGMGPGYAFEINTLVSPLSVFIGDAAA